MAKLRAEMPPELANSQGDDDEETEELDDFDINGLGASTSASTSFLKCASSHCAYIAGTDWNWPLAKQAPLASCG